MTEDDARSMVEALVGAAATDRLARFGAMVVAENERQNLIARSTAATLWARHLLDSIQLLRLAGDGEGPWLDIGTGGGFPGLAIAIASVRPMILVEPRRQRAAFLADAATRLQLGHVRVVQTSVERLGDVTAATITARAVSSIESLFANAARCSDRDTRWLLPRGAGHIKDVESARRTWHGTFHVEQSLTDPAAGIVVASGVSPR